MESIVIISTELLRLLKTSRIRIYMTVYEYIAKSYEKGTEKVFVVAVTGDDKNQWH